MESMVGSMEARTMAGYDMNRIFNIFYTFLYNDTYTLNVEAHHEAPSMATSVCACT